MTAYYNENDPLACAWLEELIGAGLIAPGIVDDRSIEDVRASDLAGFTQCHFFAGIGGWSYALRLAGWPDDRPVWTGSCPCQPFSQAGQGKGAADERHLWPAWFHLIGECRPAIVFGEQVASKAGRGWLDLVSADLEGVGYSTAAADLCAASVGAPHIRQRLYWMAHSYGTRRVSSSHAGVHRSEESARARHGEPERYGAAGELAVADGRDASTEGLQRSGQHGQQSENGSAADWLADHDCYGRQESDVRLRPEASGRIAGDFSTSAGGGCAGGGCRERTNKSDHGELGNPGSGGSGRDSGTVLGTQGSSEREVRSELDKSQPPSLLGHAGGERLEGRSVSRGERGGQRTPWTPSDAVWCRDGKWRPVEPGTFPLAHGIPGRVGLLRGYGNAIVPQVAAAFIEAYLTT